MFLFLGRRHGPTTDDVLVPVIGRRTVTRERRLSVASADRAAFLECGGKRSATPLFFAQLRERSRITWRSMHQRITPEWKSAVVAVICRRSPKCASRPMMMAIVRVIDLL